MESSGRKASVGFSPTWFFRDAEEVVAPRPLFAPNICLREIMLFFLVEVGLQCLIAPPWSGGPRRCPRLLSLTPFEVAELECVSLSERFLYGLFLSHSLCVRLHFGATAEELGAS